MSGARPSISASFCGKLGPAQKAVARADDPEAGIGAPDIFDGAGIFLDGSAEEIKAVPAGLGEAGDVVKQVGGGDAFGQRHRAAQPRRPDHGLAVGDDLVGGEEEIVQFAVVGGAGDHLAIGRGEIERPLAARMRSGAVDHPARSGGAIENGDRQPADGHPGGHQ